MKMKQYEKWITAVLTGFILSNCSSDPKQDNVSVINTPADSISEPQNKTNKYEGTGVVISITPNKKQVIIKHSTIPGFMEAMTMPFNVPDSSLLAGVHPKDSVNLFIEYDGTNVELKEIRKVNTVASQQ